MPVVRDGTGEDLNPEFFAIVGVEFGKGAGDASERVDFEVFECVDGECLFFGETDF